MIAETTYVMASNQSAGTAELSFSECSASNPPSQPAMTVSAAVMSAASGNVPYDATSESELAVARFSSGTKCGTDASLAGPHSSVRISMQNDTSTSNARLLTNGRLRSAPRARGHSTPSPAPVVPVHDHPTERGEEEAGDHADRDHQAECRCGVVRDAPGELEDGEEPDPVAQAREHLGEPELKNGRSNSRHGAGGSDARPTRAG